MMRPMMARWQSVAESFWFQEAILVAALAANLWSAFETGFPVSWFMCGLLATSALYLFGFREMFRINRERYETIREQREIIERMARIKADDVAAEVAEMIGGHYAGHESTRMH